MINFPFITLPDYYTKLLVSSIQNSTQTNNNLELYINENKELNVLIKKIFLDIDPDGFLGKIIQIAGFTGIRNRLAAVYIEYAMTGKFPDQANLSLVTELVNIENKLRHFTQPGFSRSFLLALYAKMTHIYVKKPGAEPNLNPLIIKEEHIEYMKFSKAKSTRIDWLMLELILFDHFLGTKRLQDLLKAETRYDALFSLLSADEQRAMINNIMIYGASIGDVDIFTSDVITQ